MAGEDLSGPTYRETLSNAWDPHGCGFYSFPGGVVRIFLILQILSALVLIVWAFTQQAWALVGYGVFSFFIGSAFQLYLHYYLVEGCHTARLLTPEQRNELRAKMYS